MPGVGLELRNELIIEGTNRYRGSENFVARQPEFVSYARADFNFAKRLLKDLGDLGVTLWFDQADIPTTLVSFSSALAYSDSDRKSMLGT